MCYTVCVCVCVWVCACVLLTSGAPCRSCVMSCVFSFIAMTNAAGDAAEPSGLVARRLRVHTHTHTFTGPQQTLGGRKVHASHGRPCSWVPVWEVRLGGNAPVLLLLLWRLTSSAGAWGLGLLLGCHLRLHPPRRIHKAPHPFGANPAGLLRDTWRRRSTVGCVCAPG